MKWSSLALLLVLAVLMLRSCDEQAERTACTGGLEGTSLCGAPHK